MFIKIDLYIYICTYASVFKRNDWYPLFLRSCWLQRMDKGSGKAPGCSCGLCLAIGRLVKASHGAELTPVDLEWLRDRVRVLHGELLDRVETARGGQAPELPGPPLLFPPFPVAAGKGGDSRVPDPPGAEEVPVVNKEKSGTEEAAGETEKAPEAGEQPPRAEEDKGAKVEESEEPEDKSGASGTITEAVGVGVEDKTPVEAKESRKSEEKVKKSKDKEKKKKRSRSPRSPKHSSTKKKKRKSKSPEPRARVPEPENSPQAPLGRERVGGSRGSHRPRSPSQPPTRRGREERSHPKYIPAGRNNPAIRGPHWPPGNWGDQAKSKGVVRKNRWRDIQ